MNKPTRVVIFCIVIIIVILFTVGLCLKLTSFVREVTNKVEYQVNKIDEVTSYTLLKKVEDTCRSLIVSYQVDRLYYDQYKNSIDTKQWQWAQSAKMRANKTATQYNEYILKNTYLWKDNIPTDIEYQLEIIE